MKILILGDSHGNFASIERAIAQAETEVGVGAAIHVGDFGFYPSLLHKMPKYSIPLAVIDGNHEDHTILKNKGTLEFLEERNISYKPRGTINSMAGKNIGFLGGAFNADRPQFGSEEDRTTNYPTLDEVSEFAASANKLGKSLDLLVTHSCPCEIGVGARGMPQLELYIKRYIEKPFNVYTGPVDDCGDPYLKELWKLLEHKPKNWVFGHFHQHLNSTVDGCEFRCVGSTDMSDGEYTAKNYVYNTETNKVSEEFAACSDE